MEVGCPPPNLPWEGPQLPEPVKPSCGRRATASVKLRGSCTREAGRDRTRPPRRSAAIGFGGGVRAGQGAVTSPVEHLAASLGRSSACGHHVNQPNAVLCTRRHSTVGLRSVKSR